MRSLYDHGRDVLGAEVVGAFDIAAEQRKMNALKDMNVGQARAMLSAAYAAMDEADRVGTSDQKGRRTTERGKLDWHKNELKKYKADSDAYPNYLDLQKWTMTVFIEANVSAEGSARLEAMWSAMWDEIGQRAASFAMIPGNIVDKVRQVTELPLWVWGIAAVALGYGAYKIAYAVAPAVVGHQLMKRGGR